MAIVYTGGTFDLFHAGHVNFLRQCSEIAKKIIELPYPLGDRWEGTLSANKVVVSLNTDEFILRFKGKYPVYSYTERYDILLGCKYVSEVIPNIGGADSKPAILKVRPDFIVIGSDWACKDYYSQMGFDQKWLDSENIVLLYVPYTQGVSTTELKKRITNA